MGNIAMFIISLITICILHSTGIPSNTWQYWAILGCMLGAGIVGFIDGLVNK